MRHTEALQQAATAAESFGVHFATAAWSVCPPLPVGAACPAPPHTPAVQAGRRAAAAAAGQADGRVSGQYGKALPANNSHASAAAFCNFLQHCHSKPAFKSTSQPGSQPTRAQSSRGPCPHLRKLLHHTLHKAANHEQHQGAPGAGPRHQQRRAHAGPAAEGGQRLLIEPPAAAERAANRQAGAGVHIVRVLR
jgi:hypothetical protein